MNTEIDELLKLLNPIVDAVEVNDSDSLSRLSLDSNIIWTATGSWSSPVNVTLGDLRKISDSVKRLVHNPNLQTSNTCLISGEE